MGIGSRTLRRPRALRPQDIIVPGGPPAHRKKGGRSSDRPPVSEINPGPGRGYQEPLEPVEEPVVLLLELVFVVDIGLMPDGIVLLVLSKPWSVKITV